MKVLITGAAGFIGSHLAEHLHQDGHAVTGLDNMNDYYAVAQKERNRRDLRARGIEVLPLDLTRDDLKPVLDGVELVYHLAAQPGISAHVPFAQYLQNNVVATERLLDALPTSLQLFVNVSTSSVYGRYATASEDAVPARPRTTA